MFIFRLRYFVVTLVLLPVEVLIAAYVHDAFVRPYVGDFLVVIFLYCLVRSFLRMSVIGAAISVLLFSCVVELLQYFHFIEIIHLQHSTIARIIVGTSFSWMDLVMYTVGIVFVIIVERMFSRHFA